MGRHLEELVEHQMRRWELRRRSAAAAPRRPCIAISRLPGASGAALGEAVAERLHYAFFGIEIVDWIARQTGLQRQLIAGVDEHVRNAIDRFVADGFRRGRFVESDYIRHVVRAVAAIGERGGAVILGRGSTSILPPERALRVLVVAPTAQRVEELAKQRDLDLVAAARLLRQEDADRIEFNRHHFRVDPDDPQLYDVTVNRGTLGLDAAADLVVAALHARFPTSA